jgi:hypothetical protein
MFFKDSLNIVVFDSFKNCSLSLIFKVTLDEESGKVQLENEETVILGSNTIPSFLAKSAKYATLEFAGVKFSSFSETERTISDILEKILLEKLYINCGKNSMGVILIGRKFVKNLRKSKLLIRSKNSSGNVSII